MKDALANKLEPGHLVRWDLSPAMRERGLVCRVVDVYEPTLAAADGAVSGLPVITLQIQVPVHVRPHEEAQLIEFMRVVDPEIERAVDKLNAGPGATAKGRPQ